MSVPQSQLPFMIQGPEIAFTEIGNVAPLFAGNRYSCAYCMKGGFVFGDAFFWADYGQGEQTDTVGLVGIRIKKNGENCIFIDTSGYTGGGMILEFGGNNQFQLGPATFTCGLGNLFFYNIPDMFISGGYFSLNKTDASFINACVGSPYVNSFFSPIQNLAAFEFADAFAEGAYIYASIYEFGVNGAQIINDGYIGYQATGQQIFNLVNNVLPPYVESTYQTNETSGGYLSLQGNNSLYFITGENPYNLGATNLTIIQDKTELNCASPNTGTFVSGTNNFNWASSALTTNPVWNANFVYDQNILNGWTNENPDIFIMGVNGGRGLMIYSELFIAFFATNVVLHSGVLFSDGTLIGIAGAAPGASYTIYTAQLDLAQYGLVTPNRVVVQGAICLTNYARPISPTERFKT
jgi:hypothetical protein